MYCRTLLLLTLLILSLNSFAVPVANISGPTSATVGQPVSFSSGGSFFDGGYLTQYYWFVNGRYHYTPNVSVTFNAEGPQTVWLLIYNGLTASVWKTHSVNVSQQVTITGETGITLPPSASISYTPSVVNAGSNVRFTAVTKNFSTAALNYFWNINGTPYYTKVVDHTFSSAGRYFVSLYVSSTTRGEFAQVTFSEVNVQQNIQPSVSVSISPTPLCSGDQVTFSARVSNFSSTLGLTYEWRINGGIGPETSNIYSFRIPPNYPGGAASIQVSVVDPGTRTTVTDSKNFTIYGANNCPR